jgi:tetratricopeptide (TPR) repeat protein
VWRNWRQVSARRAFLIGDPKIRFGISGLRSGDILCSLSVDRQAYAKGAVDTLNSSINPLSMGNKMDADAYFIRGNEYSAADDYEKAIADFTEAIRLDPMCAKYYFRRANNYFIKNQWEIATFDYSKAIELKPEQGDDDLWNFTLDQAYRSRAHAYRSLLRYDLAIADFTEAIRFGSGKIHDYRDRGITYKLLGNFEKALQDMVTMQQIAPDDSTFLELLAVVYEAQDNKAGMLATYDEQISRFGVPMAYYKRG